MLSSLLWIPLVALLTLHSVSAALVNATIDDQTYSIITYSPSRQWNHQPLQGWENDFYNHSRSFTYSRGATATFVFTGSAIWAQGPFAPDQAQRRISLDGVDQGVYNALAPERSPSRPFWNRTGLVYTTHTLVITHDDPGANAILALDAFIVQYDDAQDPFPYTTTTVTSYAPEVTVTTNSAGQVVSTIINGGGPNQGGTINGNPVNDGLTSPRKPYSAVIIGIIVPVVFLLVLCCVGLCLYRKRRARTRERRRQSFREKMFRRIGRQSIGRDATPLSPAASGSGSRGMRERRMSGFTYASTHYSTAEEYHAPSPPPSGSGGHFTPTSPTPFAVSFGRESQDSVRAGTNGMPYRSETVPAPNDERQGTAQQAPISFPPNSTPRDPPVNETGGNTRSAERERLVSTYDPTFSPPAEWDSTPTAARLGTAPANAARSGARQTDPHTPTRENHAGVDRRNSTSTATTPSAYVTAASHQRRPSTVFSDSESSASHQNPQRRPLSPLSRTRQRGFSATGTPASSSRPGSMLRRFSQALGISFSRSGSPDVEANRNNLNMQGLGRGAGTAPVEEQDPGYFRGMNHFNLGIPLNYRPSASAASPTDGTRISRHSQNLRSLAIDEGSTGLRSMSRTTSGRMDDLAFSSYTQPVRERVLSTVESSAQDQDAHSNPGKTEEDEEMTEKEKIIEAFDGSTIEGSMRAWSVGHGTMASQGTINGPLDGADVDGNEAASRLGRSGSQPSRRSRRSISHERDDHSVIPPPSYSVYIPPDTKGQP